MPSKKLLLVIFSSILLSNFAAMASSNEKINFKNQRGSTMQLIWDHQDENTGQLTGTFTTAVGNCLEDLGKPMPLTGYFNGNVISVAINFPHCKQTVAMVGNIDVNKKTIHTLWLDANQSNDPNGENWNSNIIGSDIFNKI